MPLDYKDSRVLVANRIKCARSKAKLTQVDVATALGITPQAISNYERGVNGVPNNVIYKMAELFGVTVDYLIGISDVPIPIPHDISALLGSDAVRLTPAELQKVMETLGNLTDLCKGLTTKEPSPLPGALECLDAAMNCVREIVSAYERNTAALLAAPGFAGYGTFTGEALRSIDALQNEFARFTLQLQGTIDKMQPPAEE